MHILLIGLFGGLGCIARYLVSGWVYNLFGRALPYGTMAVNIGGSFLLGFLMTFGMRSTLLPVGLRVGLTVGFMGGFTTFSTFSYETFKLIEEGSLVHAGANILMNVSLCLIFVAAGMLLARQL
jgi:CrcB protein